jgi:LysM repeat protein
LAKRLHSGSRKAKTRSCTDNANHARHMPEGTFAYTVKAGDTFWKLSRIYGVSLQSIVDANPGVPANNLQVGSTICIPTEKIPAPAPTKPILPVSCPDGTFAYTVKTGDTFWKLSQIYGISVQSIMDANPNVNANNLQVGSTICIPVVQKIQPEEVLPKPVQPEEVLPEEVIPEPVLPKPKPPAACPKGTFPYVVEAGDTLYQLSLNFGVSVQSIIDVNPNISLANLLVGSTICIPIAVEKPAPTLPETEDKFIYIVKECDTICTIARKFYVSVESILLKNPGINPDACSREPRS